MATKVVKKEEKKDSFLARYFPSSQCETIVSIYSVNFNFEDNDNTVRTETPVIVTNAAAY